METVHRRSSRPFTRLVCRVDQVERLSWPWIARAPATHPDGREGPVGGRKCGDRGVPGVRFGRGTREIRMYALALLHPPSSGSSWRLLGSTRSGQVAIGRSQSAVAEGQSLEIVGDYWRRLAGRSHRRENSQMSTAIMAITTRSSISVKPRSRTGAGGHRVQLPIA